MIMPSSSSQTVTRRPQRLTTIIFAFLAATPLMSCAVIQQYPNDPGNTKQNLESYSKYFGSDAISEYASAQGDERTNQRDKIVMNQMLAYDITYSDFKHRMLFDGNAFSVGGDLALLILSGLGATTGSIATKSAFAAAMAGIIGAKQAIDKDLFYQRALPALMAQMDTNRAKAKLTLLNGIANPDSVYPLAHALVDLNTLKEASGVTGAIESLTATATIAKTDAIDALTNVHGPIFIKAFETRSAITSRLKALSNPQLLALMAAMDEKLPTRPENIKSNIRTIIIANDPGNKRESDANIAKSILYKWVNADFTEDQPANVKAAKEWYTELDNAIKK